MNDKDFIEFLQWALPEMRMRYTGFRKVRKQVRKRVQSRLLELSLKNLDAYRNYLKNNNNEWTFLDSICRITISRFFRDKFLFEDLYKSILPMLAQNAIDNNKNIIRIWSAGCASGEEAYTLNLLWNYFLHSNYPSLKIEIIATDADDRMLKRAREAVYPGSSLKELPNELEYRCFEKKEDIYCLKDEFRESVTFLKQDIRNEMPRGPFNIIFCRNLVFTYFEISLQQEISKRIFDLLFPGGFLIAGSHEELPRGDITIKNWEGNSMVYQR